MMPTSAVLRDRFTTPPCGVFYPLWRDSVGAAPVARKNVFRPLDADARPERRAEEVELAGAEALARGGRGADRAVILDEQKPGAVALHLGHVPFVGADLRELLHSLRQRRRWVDARPVIGALPRHPRVEQARHPLRAERILHRRDERRVQLGVGVWKQPVGVLRQAPELRRAAERTAPLFRADELLLLQRIQMLPHGHRRHMQPPGERRRVHRAFGFQELDDAPAGLVSSPRALAAPKRCAEWCEGGPWTISKAITLQSQPAGVDSDLVKEILYK